MASKKFFKAWVKALRSGRYKQTIGQLKASFASAYCCLGVACSVQARLTGKKVNTLTWGGRRMRYEGSAGAWLLPLEAQKHLAQMNDEGSSFTEIADYIEDNYINT